jgi:large subunit ribosomal protein L25
MSVIISCKKREDVGTSSARKLRDSGLIPSVIYGKGKDNVNVLVSARELEKNIKALYNNSIIELKSDDNCYKVIAKSHDVHPVTSKIIHADFIFFSDIVSKFYVHLVFINKELSHAIKFGAVLNIVKRKLLVKCKPQYLPQRIEVDVKEIKAGCSIKISDIKIPENVELVVQDKKAVIATIIGKKAKKDKDAASDEKTKVEKTKAN